MSTRARPPRTPASAESVLEVLGGCESWEPFVGPTGAHLWRLPASGGTTYTVSRISCTCPWSTYSQGEPCKHRRAVTIYLRIEALILRHQPPPRDPMTVGCPSGDRHGDPPPPPPEETPDSVV